MNNFLPPDPRITADLAEYDPDADEDEKEPELDDDFPMYLEYDDWKYDHLEYDPEYGEHG